MICLNCTYDMCESCVNNEKRNNYKNLPPKSPCSHIHYYEMWGSVAQIEEQIPDLHWNEDLGMWEGSAEAKRTFIDMFTATHSSPPSPHNDSDK